MLVVDPTIQMTDQINCIPHINLQPVVTLTYMHLSNTQTVIENFLHTDENCTQYVSWELKGQHSLQYFSLKYSCPF